MAARVLKRNQKPPRPLVLPCGDADEAGGPFSAHIKRQRPSAAGAMLFTDSTSSASAATQAIPIGGMRMTRSHSAALQRQESLPSCAESLPSFHVGSARSYHVDGAPSTATADAAHHPWSLVSAFSDTQLQSLVLSSSLPLPDECCGSQSQQYGSQLDSQASCETTLMLGPPSPEDSLTSAHPHPYHNHHHHTAEANATLPSHLAPHSAVAAVAAAAAPSALALAVPAAAAAPRHRRASDGCLLSSATATDALDGSHRAHGGCAALQSSVPSSLASRRSAIALSVNTSLCTFSSSVGPSCIGAPTAPAAALAARPAAADTSIAAAAVRPPAVCSVPCDATGAGGAGCSAPFAAVGWFGRCRGCAQLTGGTLAHGMAGRCGAMPFCPPCAARLRWLSPDARAHCEQQLLHIHSSWASGGH